MDVFPPFGGDNDELWTDVTGEITATELAEFVNLFKCPQFYNYKVKGNEPRSSHGKEDFRYAHSPISPIFEYVGAKFENSLWEYFQDKTDFRLVEQSERLQKDGKPVEGEWELLDKWVKQLSKEDNPSPVCFNELYVVGQIENWGFTGYSDFVILWVEDGVIQLKVFELKSGFKQRTSHRIQATIYAVILESWLDELYSGEFDVSASVVTRETEYTSFTHPSDFPEFELRYPREELKLFTKEGGELDKVDQMETPHYQLASKCQSCPYLEVCYSHSVEEAGTSLLGFTRTEQEKLADMDSNNIQKMAKLTYELNESLRRPNQPIELDGRFTGPEQERFARMLSELVSEKDATDIVEQSQVLLSEFEEESTGLIGGAAEYAHDNPLPWKAGSGYANFPQHEDDLVRVYIHVQDDHRYDRLCLLSAYIISPGADPIQISEMVSVPESNASTAYEALFEEDSDYDSEERKLLRTFLSELYESISQVAIDSGQETEAKLHFYFFADRSEEVFLDALERNRTVDECRLLRKLLDERGAVTDIDEQSMRSIIQPEITSHRVTAHPTEGLLPVHDLLQPTDPHADWTPIVNGEEVNLRRTFDHGCFDYKYEFDRLKGDNTGAKVHPEEAPPSHPDDGYSLPVTGSQIPLEYIWAASGRVDIDWLAETLKDPSIEITPEGVPNMLGYLYRDVSVKHVKKLEEELHAAKTGDSAIDALNRDDKPWNYIVADSLGEITQWLQDKWKLDLKPIDEDTVKCLAEQFSAALADVEDSFDGVRDFDVQKNPISLPLSSTEITDEISLERALKDFLLMEYDARRKDNIGYYWQQVGQRLQTGKSMLIEVDKVTRNGPVLEIEASLPYNTLEGRFKDPEFLMNKIRAKEEERTSSGSFMVANRVMKGKKLTPMAHNEEKQMKDKELWNPKYIERGVLSSIVNIDFESQRVQLKAFTFPVSHENNYFTTTHRYATTNENADGYATPFSKGDWFVLDPTHGDITSLREYEKLDSDNSLLGVLDDVVNNKNPDLSSSAFDRNKTDKFVSLLREGKSTKMETPDPPNERQRKFITETDRLFSILQGPPGTGKTQTLGAAIGARIASQGDSSSLSGAVVGPSNKAVDEALKATAKTHRYTTEAADGSFIDSNEIENTLIVRVVSSSFERPKAETLPVVYVNTQLELVDSGNLPTTVQQAIDEKGATYEIRRRLTDDTPGEHIVVFGTSSGLYHVINRLGTDEKSVEFNLVCSDESSMLSLTGLLVPGSELDLNGQVLVCGDQRQMSPIITHEWEEETRKSSTKLAPYLPTLDYLRLLKGHGIEDGVFEGIDVDELAFSPGVDISMTQLNLTYRCSSTVTTLLNRERYLKEDGLNYQTADEKKTLKESLASKELNLQERILKEEAFSTTGIPPIHRKVARAVYDPVIPFLLFKHDEAESRQLNMLEVLITEGVIRGMGDEANYDMGVVTPHNSQRSSLQVRTADKDWVKADTVERFQGGEKDLVVVSATESDPDYLTSQSEFILNPNRLTVALSRMRHKVVMLASEEIFGLVPRDIDEYKNAEIWKGLHAAVTANPPIWKGTAEELLPRIDVPEDIADVNITVYAVGGPEELSF